MLLPILPTKSDFSTIVGNGVSLRLLTAHDLPKTLAWRNRDAARQQFKHSKMITIADHQAWFERQQDLADRFYFIVEDHAHHAAAGQVGIYNIDLQSQSAEIGTFVVAPEAEGQGLMKRAIMTLTDWTFDTLKLSRVYLEVLTTNQRAIRLYEACGFLPFANLNAADHMRHMQKFSVDEAAKHRASASISAMPPAGDEPFFR